MHEKKTSKRLKLMGRLEAFLKKYARTSQRGWDPNDRTYDRKLEQRIQRMDPEDLDQLMRGEEDPLGGPR